MRGNSDKGNSQKDESERIGKYWRKTYIYTYKRIHTHTFAYVSTHICVLGIHTCISVHLHTYTDMYRWKEVRRERVGKFESELYMHMSFLSCPILLPVCPLLFNMQR